MISFKEKFTWFIEIKEFCLILRWYVVKKLSGVGASLEEVKGIIVDILKAKRGVYHRPFVHITLVVIVVLGIFLAPLLANQYPTAAVNDIENSPPTIGIRLPSDMESIDVNTNESQKPRRDVISHEVKGGENLSSIAKQYGVDTISINALNKFSKDHVIHPGDLVKIPPVIGVIVKVESGDTIYSLAKKYNLASAQAIVDWPYNTFVDDEKFSLATGQTLVLPGGSPPKEKPVILDLRKTPDVPLFARGNGLFSWPSVGVITQYFSFYHNGLDVASNNAPAIIAADSGRVVTVLYHNHDYGYHVIIDHGNGYKTLYGHMSRIDVSVGDNVARGQRLGIMGSTGRSTGPHLHFVVYKNGVAINPLGLLK